MKYKTFDNPEVAARFESYDHVIGDRLLELRELIFEVAAETEGVGPLEETLKWGQPAYLTIQTKSGTTIRIDALHSRPGFGLFVHCQTTLVDRYRHMFDRDFEYDANRGLLFAPDQKLPEAQLRVCIELALLYHAGGKYAQTIGRS